MTTNQKASAAKSNAKKIDATSGQPELSYEQARDQLEQVVRELEQQNVPLEQSMQLWERGEELAQICEAWLSGARKKLADAVANRKQDQA